MNHLEFIIDDRFQLRNTEDAPIATLCISNIENWLVIEFRLHNKIVEEREVGIQTQ